MCCEMLGQGNFKLPSKLRIYVGRRKGTRTTFSLLPEQPVPCNSDHQPALTASFPVRWGGRPRRGHRGGETKGSWLWLEPSHLLLQIKDWDKKGFMPQVLRYHVIACHQLLLENLKLIPNATSLQGEKIFISVSQVREATHHVALSLLLFFRVIPAIIVITTTSTCWVIPLCQVVFEVLDVCWLI